MKKYSNLLALITLSTFCLHIDASDRPEKLGLTMGGKVTVGEDLVDAHGFIRRSDFVTAFVSGSAKNHKVSDPEDIKGYLISLRNLDQVAEELVKSIEGLRQYKGTNSLSTNASGKNLLGVASLTNDQIVDLFVHNAWKNIVVEEQIQNKIKENFSIAGSVSAKNAAIEPLVQAVLQAQDNLGDLHLLHAADQKARQLVELLSEQSQPETKEPEVVQPETPGEQAVIDKFKASTKENYVSNMQTLILDPVLDAKDPVLFKQTEAIAIDFLKKFIKDHTTWSGSVLSLNNNAKASGSGISIELIKRMIMATIITFDDPVCQLESSGAWTNNKAENIQLSSFLVKHLLVPQDKITSILGIATAQTSETTRVKDLEELADRLNR